MARNAPIDGDFLELEVLPLFRATSVAWTTAKYADNATMLAADAAYGHATYAAIIIQPGTVNSAVFAALEVAARAAYAARRATDTAMAAVEGATASAAVGGDFWSVLSDDATSIDEGTSASDVAGLRLWRRNEPIEFLGLQVFPVGQPADLWHEMKRGLLATGQDWEVWTDWYEARLTGKRTNKKLEIARATIPNETWEQGPAVVNAHIKDLIAKHKRRPPKKDPILPAAATRSRWDVFLSYSTKDEPFARFVDGTLHLAGYKVFAQFRNIPPGSNFVREMNIGLAASTRIVALLSSSYVASDHCQAEWSAAYGADPGGTSRKLVPLLIEPCDLDPLAKQIVYRSVVGLSAADAAAAILEAVGHGRPAQLPNESWPGSAALDVMTRASRDVFDVEPGKNYRLRRRSSARATGTIDAYGFAPEDLYADMRGGIARFVAHISTYRQGNFGFSDRLQSHARDLLESAPEAFSSCKPLNVNRAMVGVLRALFLDESAELLPPNDMVAYFKSDLAGYYKLLEAFYPQLTAYRLQSARNRFTLPSDRQQRGLDEFLETVPTDKDVVERDLSKDLQETKVAIEAAQNLSPSGTEEQKKADLVEPHMSAAAQAVPIWNWLANAREKFVKSGKSTEDVAKAIDSYQKLYNRLPHVKDYMDWLTSWFF
jgi:hypothetical protein